MPFHLLFARPADGQGRGPVLAFSQENRPREEGRRHGRAGDAADAAIQANAERPSRACPQHAERGMTDDTRRQCLTQSMTRVSAAWLAASWPEIAAAAEAARSGGWGTYPSFTQAEGAEVEPMAAQI